MDNNINSIINKQNKLTEEQWNRLFIHLIFNMLKYSSKEILKIYIAQIMSNDVFMLLIQHITIWTIKKLNIS